MRTMCIQLNKSAQPSVAENFLAFSPRVQWRSPGLVFLDITSTAKIFGSEKSLLQEASNLAKDFFPSSALAVADSPWTAQVVSNRQSLEVVPRNEDRDYLEPLPLNSLLHLEGLLAWSSVREIEDIIQFFETLGLKNIGDLNRFNLECFRERWGDTGSLLWKRLHGLDRQVISPLLPSEVLVEYVHLDFPVSLLSFLIHCIEKSMKLLISRLQSRGEMAQKLLLYLHCEYSQKCHLIEIRPSQASRDVELFLKLIENRLSEIDLENPVRQFEIEVVPTPEKVQQLDFWEPRTTDQDKLHQLVSIFQQSSLTTGFFKPEDAILPERSWQLTPQFENYLPIEDELEHEELDEGSAFQLRPSYSQDLRQAPRPTQLLEEPKLLSPTEVGRLRFLSSVPVERLEDSWWETSRGRDYYVALASQGECVWVYYDQVEQQYYLHGYFD